ETRAKAWAIENLIERALLRQAALHDPLPIPSEEIDEAMRAFRSEPLGHQELRSEVEMNLRVQRFVAALTARVARPQRKDLVAYYKKNLATFEGPEAVHAAHIVKNVDEHHDENSARNSLEQILSAVRRGASFEQLANEFSDCPGRGGDLGFLSR